MIVEDGLNTIQEGVDPRTSHVVAISAKTASSFKENTRRLKDYIDSNPGIQLQDLAYTTTARRMHHIFRKAYAVQSLQQLTQLIQKDLANASAPNTTTETKSAIFSFTGQGQQYMGMGRRLLESNSAFRKAIADCDNICIQQGLPSFKSLLTSDTSDAVSPSQSQLALVSIAIALASMWKSWGIKPTAVIGHSLGEYAALCVADVLSLSDTLYLVGKRAETMELKCHANSHAMAAVTATPSLVQQIVEESSAQSCEIACFNGPTSTIISGELADIGLLGKQLEAQGVKTTVLELPFAFHSAQMDPILSDIRLISRQAKFCEPAVPVASTLLGSVVKTGGVFTPDYLVRQTRQPVRFQAALEALKEEAIASDESLWLEIGAHPLCLGMVRSTLGLSPSKALPSLKRDEECWSTISQSIANAYNNGANISWTDFHKEYRKSLKLLELPTYAFDLKNYWLDYQGDWLLTKCSSKETTVAAPQPAFFTTCLQQVESEIFTSNSAMVAFSSHLGQTDLNAAVRGHLVNGVALCPSSVYAEAAFTAARYIASRMAPNEPVPAMDLSAMEIFRPLIVNGAKTDQVLKVSASRKPNERAVKITISSRDPKGSQEHAQCTIQYGNGAEWIQKWQKNSYLVQSRVDQLINSARSTQVHRLLKEMIYRQFQTVVTYSEPYHQIEELYMDCELNESVAMISFQPTAQYGNFTYSPYWLDTVAHHGGFVLNANVKTPEDTVYISHGWESFRIAAPLSEGKPYKAYVRMQPTGSRGVMAGDMYIFDEEKVVVLCKGLKFQRMKRNVLHSLLGMNQEAPPVNKSTQPTPKTHSLFQQNMKPTGADDTLPTSASGATFSDVLATIATEVGVDITELTDDAKVSDLGVDSLLTIGILEKLRDQTDLALPSSLFVTSPTIADLKSYFQVKLAATPSVAVDDEDSEVDSSSRSTPQISTAATSALSTPEAEVPDEATVLQSIIAHEVGIDLTEISPDTTLAEIGVDSLLTISILDAFKTQTGKSLPATFFQDNPTLAIAQRALCVPRDASLSTASLPRQPALKSVSFKQKYKSKSVLLQGRPVPGQPALFLLPDGAGSLFSYINLPALPSGIAVYGLDSPFHSNPQDYTIPFEAVAAIYIAEIRSLQPQGPYMLGGWSLGGIHAYETAFQLITQGETIANLLMIDSPCPGTLPPLPSPTLNLLEKAGIFDGLSSSSGPISERTRLHFLACVRALENYKIRRMPAGKGPGKVTVVWAKDGLFGDTDNGERMDEVFGAPVGEEDDPRVRDMEKAKRWLSGERTSFGPSGWDELTGTEVQCFAVRGNHFSVMFPPLVCFLPSFLPSFSFFFSFSSLLISIPLPPHRRRNLLLTG